MKKISIFLADGFEEIEGLTVVDLLRRAQIVVDMVSVTTEIIVHGAHQIAVKADCLFDDTDFADSDVLVLPGGMPGTTNLRNHDGLTALLQERNENKQLLAAICAAPGIFGQLGFLKGRQATSYPSVEDQLTGAAICHEPVVQDGHIITSRGVGTAIPFALKLIEILVSKEKADALAKTIVFTDVSA